jgi:proteasome lid subunit RPN8/RPN11
LDSRRSGRIFPDPAQPPLEVPNAVLSQMGEEAVKAYSERGEECCGLLVGDEEVPFREAHRCENDMNLHHSRDPFNYPRDARHAFHMREVDYQRIAREAEARGLRVTGIYHSHVNADAYFSELDQDFASQPLFPFPGAVHVVLSVTGEPNGLASILNTAAFRYLPEEGRFEGRIVAPAAS